MRTVTTSADSHWIVALMAISLGSSAAAQYWTKGQLIM